MPRKPYPDECPVAEVVRDMGVSILAGTHVEIAPCVGLDERCNPVWVRALGTGPKPGPLLGWLLTRSDLRPLTRTARDVLALVRP